MVQKTAADRLNVVPHSAEAERALLGAVIELGSASVYHEILIRAGLRSDSFYSHVNRWIWEAIEVLFQSSGNIDLVLILEQLDKMGRVAEVGDRKYLDGLMKGVSSQTYLDHARIIEEKAWRRRLLIFANEVAKLAYQEKLESKAVWEEIHTELQKLRLRPSRRILLNHLLGWGVKILHKIRLSLSWRFYRYSDYDW
jgi:replicative DNA helicase